MVAGNDIVAVALANGSGDRPHGLELRAHLGWAFQPCDHARLRRDEADQAAPCIRVLGVAVPGCRRRCSVAPLVLHTGRRARRRACTSPHIGREGPRRGDHPHDLPRARRLLERRRSRRHVQVDRRSRHRPDDHDRCADGRPAHGRGDEPGARLRTAVGLQLLARRLDLLRRPVHRCAHRSGRIRPALSPVTTERRRHGRVRRRRAAPGRHGAQPRSAAARPPSASARGGSRAAACAAPQRRATRRSATRGAGAPRSPCTCSRGRSAAAPRARAL